MRRISISSFKKPSGIRHMPQLPDEPVEAFLEHPVQWLGIVTAGGSSQRFNRGEVQQARSKVLVELEGISILQRACTTLLEEPGCKGLVITAPSDAIEAFIPVQRALQDVFPTVRIQLVPGGTHRRASVFKGLEALKAQSHHRAFQPQAAPPIWIVVHDGARPLLTKGWLHEALHTLQANSTLHGLIAATPVSDTLKQVEPESLRILETTNRSTLWAVQTPQMPYGRHIPPLPPK
jgi:2-C-methyl-D-erythritol 4-phosphate cytidylyltransferase